MTLTPEKIKQLDAMFQKSGAPAPQLKPSGGLTPAKRAKLDAMFSEAGLMKPQQQVVEQKSKGAIGTLQDINTGARNAQVGLVKGALKSVGDTFFSLAGIGEKIFSKTVDPLSKKIVTGIQGKPLSQAQEASYAPQFSQAQSPAFLEKQGTAEKAGAFVGEVGQFLIPASKISKATEVSKGLSFLPRIGRTIGSIATRAVGDAGLTYLQSGGDIKQSGEVGALSAGLQTLSPILRFGSRILGSTAKGLAGGISGRGTDVIEQILRTPEEGLAGIKGDVVQGLKKDALAIREYVSKLRSGSTTNYQQALEFLPKRIGAVPKVLAPGSKTTIKQAGEKTILTLKGIKSKFTTLLREHGVEINPKKAELDFLETQLSRSEEGILRNVFEDISKWKNTTPSGLDKLASKINAYKKDGETSKELNGILGSLSKGIRSYLGERVPQAKSMVERYAREQTFLEELQTYLGDVGYSKDPVGIKDTIGKLQTLFTKNKEIAKEVLESIPGGSDILGRQAGRELVTQVARSTSAIGSILQGAMNAVIRPDVIGKITAYTGMASNRASALVEALQKVSPALRITILKAVLGDQNNQK